MVCGCTFDGPEGFAARVDDISSDGHGAARAARIEVVGFTWRSFKKLI